jgi:hypothetical protein
MNQEPVPFDPRTCAIFETAAQQELWAIDNFYKPTTVSMAIRIARYRAFLESQIKARVTDFQEK